MHPLRIAASLVLILAGPSIAADAPIETAFELPGIAGNPFDFEANDVRVRFEGPDGRTLVVPAFFDGGSTWRARLSASKPGRFAVRKVTRNGQDVDVAPKPADWRVEEAPGPGFVRVDTPGKRFRFDDGRPYYPIGINLAWRGGNEPPLTEGIAKIARLGGNWARIWMTHFDHRASTNLDWDPADPPKPGELSLKAARRWDAIVEAAGREGVYLQVVLQHHGQYSTRTDPNWPQNPWNRSRGGFLDCPGDFFDNPEAIRRTKAKYRYIVARWGYSSHILAWELFNEVEWTDPMRENRPESVVAWHDALAGFLKEEDPNPHLVTTSAIDRPRGLWRSMDFEQRHAYPVEILPALTAIEAEAAGIEKPLFVGEFGPRDVRTRALRESCLHLGLWRSLLGPMPGAAQSWFWDDLDREPIIRHFRAAASFARESGLTDRPDRRPIAVGVETTRRAPLRFSPGAEWRDAPQTEFAISPTGDVPGLEQTPRFLQGDAHRAMFPRAVFRAEFPKDATFSVTIAQVARAGGSLLLSLDGRAVESRAFPGAPNDARVDETVSIRVPPGTHSVEIANPGADWIRIDRLSIDPFLPGLSALGVGTDSFAAAWVRRLDQGPQDPSGPSEYLIIPGLKHGRYRVSWRDSTSGGPIGSDRLEEASGPTLRVPVPAFDRDSAVFLKPLGTPRS